MKKIITILILTITLSSCSNKSFEVENPEKETTVEMQISTLENPNVYKVIEADNGNLHIINAETSLLEYEVFNYSGIADTLFILVMFFMVCFIASMIFRDY